MPKAISAGPKMSPKEIAASTNPTNPMRDIALTSSTGKGRKSALM